MSSSHGSSQILLRITDCRRDKTYRCFGGTCYLLLAEEHIFVLLNEISEIPITFTYLSLRFSSCIILSVEPLLKSLSCLILTLCKVVLIVDRYCLKINIGQLPMPNLIKKLLTVFKLAHGCRRKVYMAMASPLFVHFNRFVERNHIFIFSCVSFNSSNYSYRLVTFMTD
jgi:hypothetical protein